MKAFIILALVAVAAADVSHVVRGADVDAQVLRSDSEVLPDKFQYVYETSNGISGQAVGELRKINNEQEAIVVQGSNSYTAPDGSPISVTYVADENGYQPQGAHLPTPPPAPEIPEYIIRSLEYIRTHPPKPEPGQKF